MTLKSLRKQIDDLDRKLLKLIAARLALASKTLLFKKKISDREREKKLRRTWLFEGKRLGISRKISERILAALIEESKRHQRPPLRP